MPSWEMLSLLMNRFREPLKGSSQVLWLGKGLRFVYLLHAGRRTQIFSSHILTTWEEPFRGSLCTDRSFHKNVKFLSFAFGFAGGTLETTRRCFDRRKMMKSQWFNEQCVTCSAWMSIPRREWRGPLSGWREIAVSGWGGERVVSSGSNCEAHR